MKYNALGNTGLYVSELTLGTMTFNTEKNFASKLVGATGQELASKMVDISIDAGINLFDTANIYGLGESETMLGKALGSQRKDLLIATKVYGPFDNSINSLGTSRLAITREVEASLKRLGTDYIDLYQVHSWDTTTPIEETLRALDDLVHQGKVRYIGLSNFTGWQIAKADGIAKLMGTERFCSVQSYDILDTLRNIAQKKEASVAQIALAWLLHKQGVTSVIVGARKEEQLLDSLKSADIELTAEEMKQLDEISALPLEYPQWQMKMRRGQDIAGRAKDLKK